MAKVRVSGVVGLTFECDCPYNFKQYVGCVVFSDNIQDGWQCPACGQKFKLNNSIRLIKTEKDIERFLKPNGIQLKEEQGP